MSTETPETAKPVTESAQKNAETFDPKQALEALPHEEIAQEVEATLYGETETTPEKPSPSAEILADKDRLMEELLPNVAFDGWTPAALRYSAEALQMPEIYAEDLFPTTQSMIDHFGDWADRKMTDALAEKQLSDMRIRDRIQCCVETRLEILAPHKEAVRQAFSFLALPLNHMLGTQMTWRACDAMWVSAGDKSTDYNYYSKRGLLAGVLGSTMVYWLNDESEDYADTKTFITRRINNVLKIGGMMGKLKQLNSPIEKTVDFAAKMKKAEHNPLNYIPNPSRFLRRLKEN